MLFLHRDRHHTGRRSRGVLSLLALSLLSLALLAGCGGGGGGSNGNSGTGTTTTGTSTSGTNTGTQSPQTVTATTASGLTASISEPSATVSVGGAVTYTLTLTNTTASTVPVHAYANPPTTPAAGLTIRNAAGAITFQPVPGTPPLVNGTLAAGASISTTITANGFASAGIYNATAVFGDDVNGNATLPVLTITAQ